MLEKRLVFLVIFISSSRIGKTWFQSPTSVSHVLNGHKEASYCPTSSNSELFKYEKIPISKQFFLMSTQTLKESCLI